MNITKATSIFFSPTGTTRKICMEIIKGLGINDPQVIDLTQPSTRQNPLPDISGDIVILGMPVYEERIPKVVMPCIEKLVGNDKLIILIALYGNVGEGIVLKQLNMITSKAGFRIIAAASFIGEHSFSNKIVQVSKGRPNKEDLEKAKQFGERILGKIKVLSNVSSIRNLLISGNLPIMARLLPQDSSRMFTREPEVIHEKCTNCGICVKKCPNNAINPSTLVINSEKCLRCFSCVRVCRFEARKIILKKKWLVTRFLTKVNQQQKQPNFYL